MILRNFLAWMFVLQVGHIASQDCTDLEPFECDGTFYQIAEGFLSALDVNTQSYVPLYDVAAQGGLAEINGMAYDSRKDLLIANASIDINDNVTRLVQFDKVGCVEVIGQLGDFGGFNGISATGEVDTSGFYYSWNEGILYKFDMDSGPGIIPPTDSIITTDRDPGIDIAFNPVDLKIYSARRPIFDPIANESVMHIYSYDFDNNESKTICEIIDENIICNGFGAQWMDMQGTRLYASCNSTGNIYSINLADCSYQVVLSTGLSIMSNDGASCVLSMPDFVLEEECGDGIDNDADGLTDLNDPDCDCASTMPVSIIPNPSFENMNCCPMNEAALNCADDWIQASAATTDYVHTCGVLGNPFLGFEAPLPFPDGEGAIGFRDGKPGTPEFKEYTGACLLQPMTTGVEYRLDFFVGFHDAPGSGEFDMAFFGTTDCNNLPFGSGDPDFGCPTNGAGFIQLGEMRVTGENEWKNVVFNFMADQAYEAIILGPACEVNPNFAQDPYFYFDRLVLAQSSMFSLPLEITGSICRNTLVIMSTATEGEFQWYKDGVALLGETGMSINPLDDGNAEGVYEVVVTTEEGCFNSEQYILEIPSYETMSEVEICDGETYTLGPFSLSVSGEFSFSTISEIDGCDSTARVNLIVNQVYSFEVNETICAGEVFEFNGEEYANQGQFIQNLKSVNGCDSSFVINLSVIDEELETLDFSICNGQTIEVNGESYNSPGQFTQSFTAQNGCDSTLLIVIELESLITSNLNEMICEGDDLEVNGVLYNLTGTYDQSFITSEGCDSLLVINLVVINDTDDMVSFSFCEGEDFMLNGQVYTAPGNYEQILDSSNGCDSILMVQLTQIPISTSEVDASFCEGESYVLNGETFIMPGLYTQRLTASSGCDSLITLTLTELMNEEIIENYFLCDNESVTIDGVEYFEPGSFTQLMMNQNGCPVELIVIIDNDPLCTGCKRDGDVFPYHFNLTRESENFSSVEITLNEEILFNNIVSNQQAYHLMSMYVVGKDLVDQSNIKDPVKLFKSLKGKSLPARGFDEKIDSKFLTSIQLDMKSEKNIDFDTYNLNGNLRFLIRDFRRLKISNSMSFR